MSAVLQLQLVNTLQEIRISSDLPIRPSSGTSSFSNDTVRFTNFFVYNDDRICLNKSIILGGIKI